MRSMRATGWRRVPRTASTTRRPRGIRSPSRPWRRESTASWCGRPTRPATSAPARRSSRRPRNLVAPEPMAEPAGPGLEGAGRVIALLLRLGPDNEDLVRGLGATPAGQLAGRRIDLLLHETVGLLPAAAWVEAGARHELPPDRERQGRSS